MGKLLKTWRKSNFWSSPLSHEPNRTTQPQDFAHVHVGHDDSRDTPSHSSQRRLEMEFLLEDARHHATLYSVRVEHRDLSFRALGSSRVAITTPQVSLHSRHHDAIISRHSSCGISIVNGIPFVHANPVSTKICSAPRGEYHTERRAENGGVEKPKLFENFFAFSVGKRVLNVFTIAPFWPLRMP